MYKKTAALFFLMVAILAPVQEAWGQEYGDRYETVGGDQWPEVTGVTIESSSSVTYSNRIFSGSSNSYATIQAGRSGTIVLNVGQNSSVKRISFSFIRYNNRYYRPSSITVSTSDNSNGGFVEIGSASNISNTTTLTIDFNQSARQYIRLEIEAQSGRRDPDTHIYNTTLYAEPASDLPTIQHKPAKWYVQRAGGNYVDTFDDEVATDGQKGMILSGDNQTLIQATHTLVDTIYMHREETVTLTLPDRLDNNGISYSIKTYQRWYDFRTEGTFETNHSSGAPYDLLTPNNNLTGYRFSNGYVGSPLAGTGDGNVLGSMSFYYPSTDEADSWFGDDYDDSWFLVACDVSGYTDYTKEFDLNNSKNSDFRNTLYEPTLSHRIIYYICAIDNPNNWYAENISSATGDKYMEEYNITMPATRIPNYTEEMIALSKDARSFSVPGGDIDGEVSVSLDDSNNSAGIDLITDALSGEQRVIHFTYPTRNSDGTYSVNGSTATILVEKNGYNLARYNLTFEEDFRLLTQTQVEEYNDPDLEASADTFQFRMPNYLNENYILLNELNFDYDPDAVIDEYQDGIYSFPMDWDFSTYAFYDGGVVRVAERDNNNNITGWRLGSPADFEGGNRPYPEWGYYGILSQYVESGGWAWGSSSGKNAPRDDMAIRYNSSGKQSTYHLYADVSDRPGVVARLPFETDLCAGSELYVTAWVKSARGGTIGNNDNNNAAMLFTIMGVTTGDDGREVYTPIYRYQTGQIPVTYSNDKGVKVPGFGERDDGGYRNDWFQVYFSFINSSSDLNYERYVLQIDNNSASTRGGDMYLDDVRVYIARPMAEVTQLQMACTDERTLMNLRIDWERFCERIDVSNPDGNGNLGICFVDTLIFHNTYQETKSYQDALEASVVELGQNADNSRKFRMLHYHNTFGTHKKYETPGTHIAADNEYYFYALTDKDGSEYLSVDFYGDLVPNRAYWVVMVTDGMTADENNEITNTDIFTSFYTDPCALVANFKVKGDAIIKVNGEIFTPETEFCQGNVYNFTVDLRVPVGDDYVTVTNGIYYDWFFGTGNDPLSEYRNTNTTYNISLQEALRVFRNVYPDASNLDNVEYVTNPSADADPDITFTKAMYDLIHYYLVEVEMPEGAQNRPLVLRQPSLSVTLLEELRMVICPIPTRVPPEGLGMTEAEWEEANICWGYTYLELTTTDAAPTLHAGFNTTKYPEEGYDPALRIGLDQIQIASTNNDNTDKKLTINLRGAQSYDDSKENATLRRVRTSNGTSVDEQYEKIYLTRSTDPAMQEWLNSENYHSLALPIGMLDRLEAHYYKSGSTTATNEMEIRFILTAQTIQWGTGTSTFTFAPKEGYEYTFTVYYEEEAGTSTSGNVATACMGTFPVTMKVVPEYLVWNDTQKDEDEGLIGNWNYDGNWRRATNGELKKIGTATDYPTEGNTSGYVPMLFSKVIMPRNSKVQLYAAGLQNGITGSREWVSQRPDNVAVPTDSIQYDLMAFEHTTETASGSVEAGDLKTERYRVSLLNQIHFEPGAEMLHAEYLLYDTAWVDYELDKGRWYTLASPLQGVVAGDFYTDSRTGKEGSEYFKDIKFNTEDDDNIENNNRFNPSVYQRAWKGNATLVTAGNNTNGTSKEVAVAGNWSALYNDVTEAYTPGTGFSLKVQDLPTDSDKALFRLPKADPSYSYYSQGSTQPGGSVDITRYKPGRLRSDTLFTRNTDMTDAEEGKDIVVQLGESYDGTYYLVGNPFMAHLDMETFFDENDAFNRTYWLVTENGQEAVVGSEGEGLISTGTGTTVAPLQSFFVKLKTDEATGDLVSAPEMITFTQNMQVLGGTDDGLRSANALTITATTSDGRTSRAAVAYDMAASADYEASEDAELFLDSNLGDVPMVYTVAGTMATSINRTSELYNIPLGVYGSKQEMVTLSFGGLNQFSSATLYDAQEQTETPLREGKTVSVPAGTSGRYFLRAGTPTGNEVIARNAFLVYSVGGGKVMVTSSNTPLKDIRVYTMGGAQVRSIQASGMQQEIYLNRGIYLITVSDQDGLQETRKVLVR